MIAKLNCTSKCRYTNCSDHSIHLIRKQIHSIVWHPLWITWVMKHGMTSLSMLWLFQFAALNHRSIFSFQRDYYFIATFSIQKRNRLEVSSLKILPPSAPYNRTVNFHQFSNKKIGIFDFTIYYQETVKNHKIRFYPIIANFVAFFYKNQGGTLKIFSKKWFWTVSKRIWKSLPLNVRMGDSTSINWLF